MEQKTVGLIKGWSIVIGVLSLANILTLTVYPITSVVGFIAAVAIALGLAVTYAGLHISSLGLKSVAAICWAKFAWLAVNFLYSTSVRDLEGVRLVILLAQVVIVLYLLWSLRKLAPTPHANS